MGARGRVSLAGHSDSSQPGDCLQSLVWSGRRVLYTSGSMTSARLASLALVCTSFAAHADIRILNRRILPDQVMSAALRQAGLDEATVTGVLSALEGVFEFRKSRAGDQLRIVLRDGEVDVLDYRQSPVDEWQVR